MEKIYFDKTTFIWKEKANFEKNINTLLDECIRISKKETKWDNYSYCNYSFDKFEIGNDIIKNKTTIIDDLINLNINKCIELYGEKFNKVSIDCWINIVSSTKPKQTDIVLGNLKMHKHTDIQREMKSFKPVFTWVYYVQMPDNLKNKDGVLWIEGQDNKIYSILPNKDDLIIMNGDLPHVPGNSPNSKLDRIVIAGNVGFDFIKETKSLL